MATVDPDHPGTADSPREHHARAQELPEGGMDGPQGLPDGQGELARRELPLGMGAQDPEDADLRPGAQDILEHMRDIAVGSFDFSITCTVFRTTGGQPAGPPMRAPGPFSRCDGDGATTRARRSPRRSGPRSGAAARTLRADRAPYLAARRCL